MGEFKQKVSCSKLFSTSAFKCQDLDLGYEHTHCNCDIFVFDMANRDLASTKMTKLEHSQHFPFVVANGPDLPTEPVFLLYSGSN